MSLINDMLKNLDDRRTDDTEDDPTLTDLAPVKRHGWNHDRWAWILGSLLVVTTAVGAMLLPWETWLGTSTTAPSPADPKTAALHQAFEAKDELPKAEASFLSAPVLPSPETETAEANLTADVPDTTNSDAAMPEMEIAEAIVAPTEPVAANLKNIKLDAQDLHARVTFQLDQEVDHRIEATDDGDAVWITFMNTKLINPPPPLDFGSSGVDRLSAQPEDDNLIVSLIFQHTARTQSVFVPGESGGELILDIFSDPPPLDASPEPLIPPVATMAPGTIASSEGVASIDKGAAESARVAKTTRPPTQAELTEEAYLAALDRIDRADNAGAMEQLIYGLDQSPDHHASRELAAGLYIGSGQLDEAAQLLDAGLATAPDHPAFVMLRARVMSQLGKSADARIFLEASAPSLNANPEYHGFIAAMYQREGDHEKASELYTRLLKLSDTHATWWMGLGISLEAQGQYREARRAHQTALALGSLDANSGQYVQSRLKVLEAVVK